MDRTVVPVWSKDEKYIIMIKDCTEDKTLYYLSSKCIKIKVCLVFIQVYRKVCADTTLSATGTGPCM